MALDDEVKYITGNGRGIKPKRNRATTSSTGEEPNNAILVTLEGAGRTFRAAAECVTPSISISIGRLFP